MLINPWEVDKKGSNKIGQNIIRWYLVFLIPNSGDTFDILLQEYSMQMTPRDQTQQLETDLQ